MIRAVCFDVGETLVDETRQWSMWADWLGIPRFTFLAAFGAVIARGEDHRQVFAYAAPGIDPARALAEREAAGCAYTIEPRDFYPDAMPCLKAVAADGYTVGIAGNQPEAAEAALRDCGTPAQFIASSARWGVAKPSPDFFHRIAEEVQLAPEQIAYVGDRLDNDILPARAVGMFTVFIERGPWGVMDARRPECVMADVRIKTLAQLPGALRALGQRASRCEGATKRP